MRRRGPWLALALGAAALSGCYSPKPQLHTALWASDQSLWLAGRGTHFDADPPLEGDYQPCGDFWLARVGAQQDDYEWELDYQIGGGREQVVDLVESGEGGVVVLASQGGPCRPAGRAEPRMVLSHVRRDGQLEWLRTLDAPSSLAPVGLASARDGALFVLGQHVGDGSEKPKFAAIAAADRSGRLRWAKRSHVPDGATSNAASTIWPVAIHSHPGGGAVVTGSAHALDPKAQGAAKDGATAVRLAPDGQVLWQRTIAASVPFALEDSAFDNAGTLLMAGCTHPRRFTGIDNWIAALTEDGRLTQQHRFAPRGGCTSAQIVACRGGGSVLLTEFEVETPAALFFDGAAKLVHAWSLTITDEVTTARAFHIRAARCDPRGVELMIDTTYTAVPLRRLRLSRDGTVTGCEASARPITPELRSFDAAASDAQLSWKPFSVTSRAATSQQVRSSQGRSFEDCRL